MSEMLSHIITVVCDLSDQEDISAEDWEIIRLLIKKENSLLTEMKKNLNLGDYDDD